MIKTLGRLAASAAIALSLCTPAAAQIDARMFRQPDVSATQIAFVYAGDIWLVPKSGGIATRLSSPPGEESFPRFSPDGTQHRLQRQLRRQPRRLRRPDARRRAGAAHASPDGRPRHRLAPRRQARAVRVEPRERAASATTSSTSSSVDGGLPEKLPVPYGEFGAFSPDGERVRLHAAVAGLPQLEALSRRLGARPLALRPEDVRVAEPHAQPGQRRAADVARQHDLLPLRSRRGRAQQHLGARHGDRRGAPGDAVQTTSTSRSRRSAPTTSSSRPAAGSTCSILPTEKTNEVAVHVVTDRLDAAAAHREGRRR